MHQYETVDVVVLVQQAYYVSDPNFVVELLVCGVFDLDCGVVVKLQDQVLRVKLV